MTEHRVLGHPRHQRKRKHQSPGCGKSTPITQNQEKTINTSLNHQNHQHFVSCVTHQCTWQCSLQDQEERRKSRETEGETDRERGRERERQTDRQGDREGGREIERERDRETDRQGERETDRQTDRLEQANLPPVPPRGTGAGRLSTGSPLRLHIYRTNQALCERKTCGTGFHCMVPGSSFFPFSG